MSESIETTEWSRAEEAVPRLESPEPEGSPVLEIAQQILIEDRAPDAGARLLESLISRATAQAGASPAVVTLARPRARVPALRAGDLVLSSAPGHAGRWTSIIAHPEVLQREALAAAGLRPLEFAAGGYVHVIDAGPTPRGRNAGAARRLTDPEGRVVADRAVVRLETSAPVGSVAGRVVGPAGVTVETAESPAPRIDGNALRYLAFEGGGGKGFTFLGAIQALEDRGVLRYRQGGGLVPPSEGGNIHGVAGASAGAITAMLLATGYDSRGIRAVLSQDFTRFFEDPRPGQIVRVRTGPQRTGGGPSLVDQVLGALPAGLRAVLPLNALISTLALGLLSSRVDPPLDRLLDPRRIGGYLDALRADFGFFDGWEARRFFAARIRDGLQRIARRSEPGLAEATFATHHAITGVKLAVAGVNLATRRSELFSVDATPNVPVADAIRISMGIPIAFKPVVIIDPVAERISGSGRHTMSSADMRGYWVDGGMLNNMPVRAFDDLERTLGLRLDVDQPDYVIGGLLEYLGTLVGTLTSAGEAHVSATWRTAPRTIALDTRGLATMDFDPPRNVRDARIREARAKVLDRVTAVNTSPAAGEAMIDATPEPALVV